MYKFGISDILDLNWACRSGYNHIVVDKEGGFGYFSCLKNALDFIYSWGGRHFVLYFDSEV